MVSSFILESWWENTHTSCSPVMYSMTPEDVEEMWLVAPQLVVVIFYRDFFCVPCSCTGVRKLLSFHQLSFP